MIEENKGIIGELEEEGLIILDEETGNPRKPKTGKLQQYSAEEVCAVIFPYIVQDFTISNRELGRLTGIDYRTIIKYRKSDTFKEMLARVTNDQLLILRGKALQEMAKILSSPKASDNSKIKASQIILSHSEAVAELMLKSGKEPKQIDVNDLIRELENM
jgi:hypothetical protein